MKRNYFFIFFLVINFTGLAIGSWLMDGGSTGDWYNNLSKAPWTPTGWVFGAAWTTIMLTFSWYLAELFFNRASKFLWILYGFQVLLNVSWNWIFFSQHLTNIAPCYHYIINLGHFLLLYNLQKRQAQNSKIFIIALHDLAMHCHISKRLHSYK